MGLSRRWMPRPTQLATSCAMEHFTAILADTLLRDRDQVRTARDPAYASLWLWHAAEEIEHKAVCFDVYQHVCGKGWVAWLHRVIVMAVVTLMLAVAILIGFSRMKSTPQEDGSGRSHVRRPKASKLARDIPFALYLDYYRPSFHPWRHQNAHLVEEWKALYPELQVPV